MTSGSMTSTSGRSAGTTRTSAFLFEQAEQVLAVPARLHRARQPLEIAARDVSHAEGDLLEARDHQTLSLFDRVNVVRRLDERVVGAGVEPGDAARQLLDVQLSAIEIRAVDVGDLELAARRRLEVRRDVDDLVVVEVQPGHRVRRLGTRRLFLETDRAAVAVELDDSVALGIADLVPEHGRALDACGGGAQVLGKVRAVEDVVAER